MWSRYSDSLLIQIIANPESVARMPLSHATCRGIHVNLILNDPAALWSIIALTLLIFGGGYMILRFLKSTRG